MGDKRNLYGRVVFCTTNLSIGLLYTYGTKWYFFYNHLRDLTSEWETTRIEALHWIATLLAQHRTEVIG